MLDPNQLDFFSDAEKELIKKTFGGDNRTLNALRTLLWQFDLTDDEKKLIEFSPEVLALLKKFLLPSPSKDIPVGQNRSPYLKFNNIGDLNPLIADLKIQANDLFIQYFKQQFNELVTGDAGEGIILSRLPSDNAGVDQKEIRLVNMIAYLDIAGYIESRITELGAIANPKPELTPEELKAKQLKDSSR